MVDFKAGPEEAAKMLSGLSKEAQEKALSLIVKKDPEMATLLRELLVSLEKLKELNLNSLQKFLSKINLNDLGYALRIHSTELRDYILQNISSNMKIDLERILLGPPISIQKAKDATARLSEVLQSVIDSQETEK